MVVDSRMGRICYSQRIPLHEDTLFESSDGGPSLDKDKMSHSVSKEQQVTSEESILTTEQPAERPTSARKPSVEQVQSPDSSYFLSITENKTTAQANPNTIPEESSKEHRESLEESKHRSEPYPGSYPSVSNLENAEYPK